MERIGLVSADQHLRSEIKSWLKDLPTEFEFVDLGPPNTGDPKSAVDEKPPEPLRLVIYDSRHPTKLSKLRSELDLEKIPWLAIGREEHARNPHDAAIDSANDLILLPLDRSVFLQKIEYLLAAAESVTPTFLYSAKNEFPIELAKPVHITHISETSCTILAPLPVARGVEGTLLCRLFGGAELERVEVRAIQSTPIFDSSIASPLNSSHPNAGPQPKYEVQLRLFGLKHQQLLAIRKWLSQSQPLTDIPRSEDDPQRPLHVAIISPDASHAATLRSSLEHLAKVEIDEALGLKRFQGQLMARQKKPVNAGARAPLSAIVWSEAFVGPKTHEQSVPLLPSSPVTLFVRKASESQPSAIEKTTPLFKGSDKLLGLTFDAWSRDASNLFHPMSEHDRGAIEEAIEWCIAKDPTKDPTRPGGDMSLICDYKIDDFFSLKLQFKISLAEAATPTKTELLKVSIEDLTNRDPKESSDNTESPAKNSNSEQKVCEAVMVDASLLNADIKEKIAQLQKSLETFKIKNIFGNTPPIIIFNADEKRIAASEFRGTGVRQLVYAFNDRRYQAEVFISLSRPELWTSPQLSVAGLKTDQNAFLARPSVATAVSEVSLTVIDRAPLKGGTELLILSPIWSQAPEGLWARLRTTTVADGQYENEFIFFGVSDLVQKEIRKFTRLEYVKKKAQGQS